MSEQTRLTKITGTVIGAFLLLAFLAIAMIPVLWLIVNGYRWALS